MITLIKKLIAKFTQSADVERAELRRQLAALKAEQEADRKEVEKRLTEMVADHKAELDAANRRGRFVSVGETFNGEFEWGN